ncbi:MAG: serine hydrolase [Deltaproteobacteria bacterium]|nr:serine hydrolase [Deltaproteobacteria bacterium]
MTYLEEKLTQLLDSGVVRDVFPGAVLLVASEGEIKYHQAVGLAARKPEPQPIDLNTIFDLASLTKALATAAAMMKLIETGRLSLDTRLGDIIGQAGDKADISLRLLLCHSAGLPDHRPYYRMVANLAGNQPKAAIRRLAWQEGLVYPPGKGRLYSDLGYILLDWVIETVTGVSLYVFLAETVYGPLGLTSTFFRPVNEPDRPASGALRFAATEECPWRGRMLVGEVHDENTFAAGGVSGQAGLFSTAAEVYSILRSLWRAVHEANGGPFHRDVVRLFTARQNIVPESTFALGFDTPSATGSSSGKYFPQHAVGHLGFTGTSFWMDIDSGFTVILLTNRVHLGRDNILIRSFRPILHDLAVELLGPKAFQTGRSKKISKE